MVLTVFGVAGGLRVRLKYGRFKHEILVSVPHFMICLLLIQFIFGVDVLPLNFMPLFPINVCIDLLPLIVLLHVAEPQLIQFGMLGAASRQLVPPSKVKRLVHRFLLLYYLVYRFELLVQAIELYIRLANLDSLSRCCENVPFRVVGQ